MEVLDLIGSFLQLLSIPNMAVDSSGIFDTFYTVLMKDLMIPLSNKFNAVTNFIRPIFTFAIGLFVSIFGYMILAGKIKAPAQDFVWRITIIAIVFWVVFDAGRYEKIIVRPVMGATTAVTQLIAPQSEGFFGKFTKSFATGQKSEDIYNNNRGLFMGLDVAIESVSIILKGTVDTYTKLEAPPDKPNDQADSGQQPAPSQPEGGTENQTDSKGPDILNTMLLIGFIGLIITGAVMVYVTAGAILMLNHVFLVLMLMIGPAFIAMAVYKPTREFAKKWMARVLAIALTIAICSAMAAFILSIQKDITKQMCKATGAMQAAYAEKVGIPPEKMQEVKKNMIEDFRVLQAKIVLAAASNIFDSNSQSASQSVGAVNMVQDIIAGCNEGTNSGGAGNTGSDADKGVNVLFQAIQYLIICMILNRLISESANVAGAIVNSSGISTGTSQEVSGGAQGMTGRAGQGGGSGATKGY